VAIYFANGSKLIFFNKYLLFMKSLTFSFRVNISMTH